jgi:hypothetical protein
MILFILKFSESEQFDDAQLKGIISRSFKRKDRMSKCSHSYWGVFEDSQKETIRGIVRGCFKDSLWIWKMQEARKKSMGMWKYGSAIRKLVNSF